MVLAMYTARQVLNVSGELAPGERRTLVAKPTDAFRPERLVIAHGSFRVPRWLRALTWLPGKLGRSLGRAHVALARLLRVDLTGLHSTRLEPLTELEADAYIGEVAYDADDRPCRVVPVPPTLRDRALRPLGAGARALRDVRVRWQQRQLGKLVVHNILVGKRRQLAGDPLPAALFSTNAFGNDLALETCALGGEIGVDIENDGKRSCHLAMAFVGIAVTPNVHRRAARRAPEGLARDHRWPQARRRLAPWRPAMPASGATPPTTPGRSAAAPAATWR